MKTHSTIFQSSLACATHWILAAIFLLVISPAWADTDAGLLKRMDYLEKIIQTAIIASPRPCSTLGDHWAIYPDAEGRFLLSAGGDLETKANQKGGDATVELKVEHLPKHRHEIETYEWGHTVDGDNRKARINVNDGEPWNGQKGILKTNLIGGGTPLNNLPPYVAVYFCTYSKQP